MKKEKVYIANWKMNLNIEEELNWCAQNYDVILELPKNLNTKIVLCPSFLSIYPLTQMFKTTEINIGAQDCSTHNKGSFTGQICAESLNRLECNYCIIGHSERREYNKETDQDIFNKFEQLINHKISPILCFGETPKDNIEKRTLSIIEKQLDKIFTSIKTGLLNVPKYLTIYLAYEPLGSIGTGIIPDLNHLENIYTWLWKKIDLENLTNIKLIYGGSVNEKNIHFFKKIDLIDGFLIGTSSLNFTEFEKIVKL